MEKKENRIVKISAADISLEFIRDQEKNEREVVCEKVDFEAESGWITYIQGYSGCGKSLLLKIVSALLPPYPGMKFAGQVQWHFESQTCKYIYSVKHSDFVDNNGNALRVAKEIDVLRVENFGFIFQGLNLLEDLTAGQNVLLPLYLKRNGLMSKQRRHKVTIDEVPYREELDLEGFWDTKIKYCSGGQKERVAVARALITHPDVIVADEPTTGLDPENAEVINNIFERERQSGKLIIVVTHDDLAIEHAQGCRKIYSRDDKEEKSWRCTVYEDCSVAIARDKILDGACPHCGCSSWKKERVENTGIIIDICCDCGGVWLDNQEINDIIDYPKKVMKTVRNIHRETETAIKEIPQR